MFCSEGMELGRGEEGFRVGIDGRVDRRRKAVETPTRLGSRVLESKHSQISPRTGISQNMVPISLDSMIDREMPHIFAVFVTAQ
jgi:hypothetical protein